MDTRDLLQLLDQLSYSSLIQTAANLYKGSSYTVEEAVALTLKIQAEVVAQVKGDPR